MSGLYDARWQRARAAFLKAHPLCVCPHCDAGRIRVRAANVVDHDPPHRGDPAKFWDQSTWRALSKHCHDSYKQRLEKSGRIAGADAAGVPLDPRHPWNKRGAG
jgi:5-methylcytosine-specific restriction protein A